ncbi:MAG: type IV secretory system conjugative DNA transfer family protein [Phycisphaerales bacterium]
MVGVTRWFAKIGRWQPWLRAHREATQPGATDANPWPLSMPILAWNEEEVFRLADAVCGVQVFGTTGSGKSTGSVAALLRAYLRNQFGMMLLTVKPDDAATYRRLCAEAGRSADVVMLGPLHDASFNFISEAALGSAGLIGNLTAMLSTVSRIALGGEHGGGREDGRFWMLMESRLLTCCAELLIRAGEPVTTLGLERLVTGIPADREQVADGGWRERSFVYACLREAELDVSGPDDETEFRRLCDYFLLELATLSSRTKSTVQASATALLDMFNRPVIRKLLSAPQPSFDMSMLQRGKILIVDCPVLVHQSMGRLVQLVLKHCFQLAQSRRDVRASPRPVALVVDESHLLTDLEHDAAFQTTARGTRTCTVYATQSISNYLGEHGDGSAAVEARVHALLTNLACHLFHQTTDTKTVEYAQALFGKRRQLLMNGGMNQRQDDWASAALGFGGPPPGRSAGFSEHVDWMVQASDFLDLARGGPDFGWTIEALLYQGGKTFPATNRPFLPVRFAQHPDTDMRRGA